VAPHRDAGFLDEHGHLVMIDRVTDVLKMGMAPLLAGR